ncbi:MAG: PAS domain S-box protein [Candidatus Eremiobacteraeota bacterium]|nr:PAS domain S-box protein [Candidatus Eremiobacteraeota bacterium]
MEAALRASEERFRQVEEHAPIGLALIDLHGRFLRVNPALCRLTGYDEEALLATGIQALTHPDDLAENLAHIEKTIEGVVESYEIEKRYLHRDGHAVWVLVHRSIVRGADGRSGYLIAQIADISSRKVAEKAIEDAQISTLAAAEAKSRFLATMSHEIRTPMNGIIGMTELLSLSDLSREQNEFVQVVYDSGRSLLRVLDDILDYSKIEAGKLELEHLDFDLPSQVRSVVALLKPQYELKGVSLTTRVEDDVAVSLIGDPGRVRQILINLVGNALKFTPAGGSVDIAVSAEPGEDGGRAVCFRVVDTGVGIAPEVRHRLFQPFSQADGSTTRKYGGTGLGLSICKQLVDLMGGRIGATSAVPTGSSFWFTIPFLRGSTAGRVLDAPSREMGERRAAVKPRSERVLLAEDNEVNTLLALKQFKQLGFEVTIAANGQEAVDACERGSFDLVFMDCHMPVVDGFEATKSIRSMPADLARRLPIVALTANASADDRAACFAAGMDDYVAKPVSLGALQTVLARWLP